MVMTKVNISFFEINKNKQEFFYQDMAANLTDVCNAIVEFLGA